MIIMQRKKRPGGYLVPAGGEVLWYGPGNNPPTGWSIDGYASNVFVRGADVGGATNTPTGNNTHTHTNPTTGTDPNHTHPIGGGNTGDNGTDRESFNTSPQNLAPHHTHTIGTGNSGSAGSHSHPLPNTNSAEVYPPHNRLYWIKCVADAAIPLNGVVMFDGPIANRPVGYELCDGNGSTVDLRDKFVYGASQDSELGVAGGNAAHVHTNPSATVAGAHSHSLSLTTGGAPSQGDASGYTEGIRVSAGGHAHSINGTSDSDPNHTHTVGNSNSGDAMPPYLKLYFVMRVV